MQIHRLPPLRRALTFFAMSTLAEIESAADALPAAEKQELLLFLAARLRSAGWADLPPPRKFSREQIEEWIAEDEADMRQLRAGA
jgi:hypothetical protein